MSTEQPPYCELRYMTPLRRPSFSQITTMLHVPHISQLLSNDPACTRDLLKTCSRMVIGILTQPIHHRWYSKGAHLHCMRVVRSVVSVVRSGISPQIPKVCFVAWCDPGGDNILPGTSNDRFLRPNAGLTGVHRTGDVDPLTLGEGASPSQPSRHIRRTGSTKSLPDGRRRNNGVMPTSIRGKSRLNP